MRICLLENSNLQLAVNLPEINIKKRLLQLVKAPAPPLGPMPEMRTRPVTAIATMTTLKPVLDQTISKKKIRGNCY